MLKCGGLEPAKQRQTSIPSDSWNAPVAGEPVAAGRDVTGDANVTWHRQSSPDGSIWTDIAGITAATYIPVATDAASGVRFLRAPATFTASGASQTLTTVNIAVTAAVAANRTAWRWQRCDAAAMATKCKLAQSGSSTPTYTESTPAAGADTDVGKYLRAYAYYADSANSNVWTRTQTPILVPVVAAAPAAPTTL